MDSCSMNNPRSRSPTSPNPDSRDSNFSHILYFCRFPGCSKGYASTDGVRKHCRKHHPDWLASLDEHTRESGEKHSAASYCTTTPSDPDRAELYAEKARKRQRADSLSPQAPQLEPPAQRPSPLSLQEEGSEVGFPKVMGWPSVLDPLSDAPPPSDFTAKPRSLLDVLEGGDDRMESPYPELQLEPMSQSFFRLDGGMPAPKRGHSLTSDAMLELARESETSECGNMCDSALSLEVYFKDDPKDEASAAPERTESVDFLGDLFA